MRFQRSQLGTETGEIELGKLRVFLVKSRGLRGSGARVSGFRPCTWALDESLDEGRRVPWGWEGRFNRASAVVLGILVICRSSFLWGGDA